jgi:hypothetical protein
MKHAPGRSMAYDRWKDFLTLPKRDLRDRRNRVARLVGPPLMPRPLEASIQNGFLTWTWYSGETDGSRHSPALQTAPSRLCFAFARLAQASDEDILCFAKQWGPLNRDRREEESMDHWRRYARLAQALMRFTAQVISGDHGDEEDWREICQSTPVHDLELKGLKDHEQMAIIAAAVNIWFDQAREHGILTMLGRDLQVMPHASALFGVLITQIAHVIARSDQMAVCAGCSNPFEPERPITRGSRQYCKSCRKKKVPQRHASWDWRRRNQEKDPGEGKRRESAGELNQSDPSGAERSTGPLAHI